MTEIFTAKSVEEAKALAAAKFGKDIKSIRFEVIDEGKKGFFGIGKSDAKVRATYVESVQTSAAPVKQAAPKAPETKPAAPAAPKKTVVPAEKIAAKPEKITKTEEIKEEIVKSVAEPAEEKIVDVPSNEPVEDDEEYMIENFTLIEDESLINSKVKLAKDYVTSILRAIGIEAQFTVYQNETGAVINIDSDNNGTIIGRRGETLDAIQYLCSIIANKGDKDYFRITIDCLGYRKKRKETLEQLAAKVAKSVLRTGRSQPLEPMNPYERRVIHSAISAIEGVSSRSVGEEPYRKIIISSNNPKNGGRRRDNRRGGENRGERKNNRPRRENFERRTVDLSTSFEKDYKRPKPEDNIEGGLYGKIEL